MGLIFQSLAYNGYAILLTTCLKDRYQVPGLNLSLLPLQSPGPMNILFYFLPHGSGWGKGLILPACEEPGPFLFRSIPPSPVAP